MVWNSQHGGGGVTYIDSYVLFFIGKKGEENSHTAVL